MRFEDSRKRPKSEELKKAYPELYNFLLTGKPANKFKVGILHLDAKGSISNERAVAGATPINTVLRLKRLIHAGLIEIAKEMRDNPTSELGKLEYLTAGSMFFRAKRVAENLGFEIFDMDDDEEMKFKSASHENIKQTYKKSNELGTTKRDLSKIDELDAKVGLISREAIMALLKK